MIETITLDHDVTIEDGNLYAVVVSKASETTRVYPVQTLPGTGRTLTLATPLDDVDPAAPAVGDHIAFGILGLETMRCIIRDIEPTENDGARITLINEAPAIHNAGDMIPEFDPVVTPQLTLDPPIILNVRSDESSIIRSQDGTVTARVVFDLAPAVIDDIHVVVMIRPSNTDASWQSATVQDQTSRQISIIGVELGETYDFRIFYTHPNYFASVSSATFGHTVVGDPDPPSALTGLTINTSGGLALIRWDLSPDIDVRVGGWIDFRHSVELDSAVASWTESTSIGKTVNGSEEHVWLPLLPGTYLLKTFDNGNRPSGDVAKISTKQATVLVFSPVVDVIEHPTFSGSKTGMEVVSNTLRLVDGSFDSTPVVDDEPDWDAAGGGLVTEGTYDFNLGMDFGAVKKVRLTRHLVASIDNPYDFIDGTDDWDSAEDVDGVDGAPVDAWVEVKITDDDPTGSPTWSDWIRVESGEFETWGVLLRLVVKSDDASYNLIVSELSMISEDIAA